MWNIFPKSDRNPHSFLKSVFYVGVVNTLRLLCAKQALYFNRSINVSGWDPKTFLPHCIVKLFLEIRLLHCRCKLIYFLHGPIKSWRHLRTTIKNMKWVFLRTWAKFRQLFLDKDLFRRMREESNAERLCRSQDLNWSNRKKQSEKNTQNIFKFFSRHLWEDSQGP